MNKKLLVICGPTATGKTPLGIRLAEKLEGEVISADSRQVYKDMDIGTGKDIPKNASFKKIDKKVHGYYEIDGIKVWGYDLVSPEENFSVADYVPIARAIIKRIWDRGKLPILVGGTGLYIQGAVDGIKTASVPRSDSLREKLEDREVDELYDQLAQLDPIKAASLNSSDRKNPRRLVRAIEIAQWEVKGKKKRDMIVTKPLAKNVDLKFVGVTGDREKLCKKIEERVKKRLDDGIKDEIRTLIEKGVDWDDQSMDSLGYKQWKEYFEGDKKEKEVIEEWEKEECQYTKRQMTWFKKDKRIKWFNIFDKNYPTDVEKDANKWYKK